MSEKNHPVVAARIKEILRLKGWTQSELAERAGVTQQAVQQWASGKVTPSGKRLRGLALATGKPESWFFSELEESPSTDTKESRPDGVADSEARLLELFRQLPEAKKQQVLHHVENVVEEVKILFEELLTIHKNTHR